jgi:hypothetical protein
MENNKLKTVVNDKDQMIETIKQTVESFKENKQLSEKEQENIIKLLNDEIGNLKYQLNELNLKLENKNIKHIEFDHDISNVKNELQENLMLIKNMKRD